MCSWGICMTMKFTLRNNTGLIMSADIKIGIFSLFNSWESHILPQTQERTEN